MIDHTRSAHVPRPRSEETSEDGFPTTVIPNGADIAHIARSKPREVVRNSLGFATDDFVLGYVGRFSEEKRPHALIEATAKLPRNFKVLLVGWGPMRQQLMEMANELIPGRFAIVAGDGSLGDYYQSMDAFCLLSASGGFGLVVLEAMLSGLPVIATPVGCAPEVIHDRVNGIIVSEDANSVAQAATLLQDYPQWSSGLATEGQLYAEAHGHASVMARRYEELLSRLHADKQEPSEAGRPAPVASLHA